MSRVLLLALLLAACRDPPPPPRPEVKLTPAEKAEVQSLIDAARQRITASEAKRNQALARPRVKQTSKPCPIGRKDFDIDENTTANGLTVRILGATRLVLPNDKRPALGKALSDLDLVVYSINKHAEGSFAVPQAFLAESKRKLDEVKSRPLELALVLARFDEPQRLDAKSFKAGHTSGTVYVWSEAAGAIVCAADVEAQSSSEVSVTTHSFGGRPTDEERSANMSAHLSGELIVNTMQSAFDRLVAVEPLEKK
jgi:hypothetical protein